MNESEVYKDLREYDHREYYKIGERIKVAGHVVEVATDDKPYGTCNDCFLVSITDTLIGCSSFCSGCERKDGTHVHFRLVDLAKENTPEYELFNPDKEYAIYERFQHNGVVAECRKCSSPLLCNDCVLYPCNRPSTMNCRAFRRKDNISVYYKKLEDVRP